MPINVNNDSIAPDAFLSEHLGLETFRIAAGRYLDEEALAAIRELQPQGVFLYCKIPVENIAVMEQLAALKFQLVDNLITLEKDILLEEEFQMRNTVRMANTEDEEAAVAIARTNFRYSRFHADERISDESANRVKTEWVRNYFHGKRGADMVLGIVDDKVAGFVQLLRVSDNLVVDLIAVDECARKRGLATDMINYAQKYCRGNCVKYRVGTQLANTPSINLYQNMGFTVVQKDYVYHFHT